MIKICKHCLLEFDITLKPNGWMANHTRWCDKNPKRKEYQSTLIEKVILMNNAKKLSGITNQFTKAKSEGRTIIVSDETKLKISKSHTGITLSPEVRKKMSISALKSNHRRLRRKIIDYMGIKLDSTWEYELVVRLDYLKIKWNRPNPIKWIDNMGITRNYFPDFYLPDYEIYLDPKNPYAYKVQKEKIDCLLSQYNNIFFILSLDECKKWNKT